MIFLSFFLLTMWNPSSLAVDLCASSLLPLPSIVNRSYVVSSSTRHFEPTPPRIPNQWFTSRQIYRYKVVTYQMNSLPPSTLTLGPRSMPSWNLALSREYPFIDLSEAITASRTALDASYKSYTQQGPERKDNVGIYKKEDAQSLPSLQQILIFSHDEVIARVQINLITSREKPSNIEAHFPESTSFIREGPGIPILQIERFLLLKPEEVSNEENRKNLLNKNYRKALASLLVLQLSLHLQNDYHNSSVIIFQVNTPMLKLLQRLIPPELLSDRLQVQQPNVSSHSEWIIKMTQPQITALSKVLLSKRLTNDLHLFINDEEADELVITVEPEEAFFFQSLGAYRLSEDYVVKMQNTNLSRVLGVPNFNLIQTSQTSDDARNIHHQASHVIRIGKKEAEKLLEALEN